MTSFASQTCQPCSAGTPPLPRLEAEKRLEHVAGWELALEGAAIERKFEMQDFAAAIDFINEIAKVAEAENHHPDVHLTDYRQLHIVLSTHAIGGLSQNDFILAAKINLIPRLLKD